MSKKCFTLMNIGLVLVVTLLALKFLQLNQRLTTPNITHQRQKNARIIRIEEFLASKTSNTSFYTGAKFFKKFPAEKRPQLDSVHSSKCTMQRCFDATKCHVDNFKIYLYNTSDIAHVSVIYKNILATLNSTAYVTTNASEACLLILPFDTLSRDRLSANYVKNLNELIGGLAHWNSGRNHLIFNMYSGSYPNYAEQLEIDANFSIIVKASFSVKTYRKHFDLAFPLFHADMAVKEASTCAARFGATGSLFAKKKYLLTFKGKRYLHGIGTETRNSVYHLNNERDILLLTTCKHGNKWVDLKDERCDVDISLYEQ